jgi:PleD family two-component response regulator
LKGPFLVTKEQIQSSPVLIVDDNILNVQILKRVLIDAGFTNLTLATEATKAVDLYRQLQPDLVLLDFNMPGLNGLEIMAELSLLDPQGYLPVLMITAEEDSGLRAAALEGGAKDFLKKPYDRLEVVLRSRNMIEVRLLYKNLRAIYESRQ